MKHQTLALAADRNAQYGQPRKPTERDMIRATMERSAPWATLCSVIEPNDPKAGQVREKHAPPALPHGPEQRLHGDSAPA